MDVVDSVLPYLGMVRGKFTEGTKTQEYLYLSSCGWKPNEKIVSENETDENKMYFVVDQLPSHHYPHLFVDDMGRPNVYLAVSKLSDKPEYKYDEPAKTVLQYAMPTRYAINSRLNHWRYKLDETKNTIFNFIPCINGGMQIVPSVLDCSDEDLENYIETYTIENYAYSPLPDKISYQFPPPKACCMYDKIVAFKCVDADIKNYELVVVPSLKHININDIADLFPDLEVINIGYMPYYFGGRIAIQFPRPGVWYLKKINNKVRIYTLTATSDYKITSRIYNLQ